MLSKGEPIINASYVYGIVSVILCALAVAFRFVATRRAGLKGVIVEDLFALAAFCFYIITVTLFLLEIDVVNGDPIEKLPYERLLRMLKLQYALDPFGALTQLCAKYSLLFLYHRLFRVNRNFARWVYFVAIVQGAWTIAAVLTRLFRCQPVSSAWDVKHPGKCYNTKAYLVAMETINSSIDFIMVILAVWMVKALQMRTSVKWRLSAVFAIGGLSGVAGFVKIGEAYNTASGVTNTAIVLWRLVQDSASIICCCAPVYNGLIPRQAISHFVASVSSTITSRLLRSRSSQASMQRPDPVTCPTAESAHGSTRKLNGTYFGTPVDKGNAWVDIDAGPTNAGEPGHPLRGIHVRRNIESV
ncbi:uncharacterized protein PG986_010099 [Apiospora aurea]|uniref:Rhodopsin domain-containing protein n=1 Tax=Apiospora aurea TaxID=335848 RepID=A0ABR1Q9X0_9PEZI